jgi:hypothetical protein
VLGDLGAQLLGPPLDVLVGHAPDLTEGPGSGP